MKFDRNMLLHMAFSDEGEELFLTEEQLESLAVIGKASCWIVTDSRLSHADRGYLTCMAYDMYRKDKRTKPLKRDSFEGIMYNRRKSESFNGIVGNLFEAELDTTAHGRTKVKFLLRETYNPN